MNYEKPSVSALLKSAETEILKQMSVLYLIEASGSDVLML